MVKRVVDTGFWTSPDVIDRYSIEDRYFMLYLLTNPRSRQCGIYALPKKIICFETGYQLEVVQVLLDRFENTYKVIRYSSKTQEITILNSLQFTILKGGKPVQDLLDKELGQVEDVKLLKVTLESMRSFWLNSKRPFDRTILQLFEKEINRRESNQEYVQKENDVQVPNEFYTYSSELDNTVRQEIPSVAIYEFIQNFLPSPTTEDIVMVNNWIDIFNDSIVLEALRRSKNASHPYSYINKILNNWKEIGVELTTDISLVDHHYFKEQLKDQMADEN